MNRLDLGLGLALMPGLLADLERVPSQLDRLEVEPQPFCWETGDDAEPFRPEADDVLAVCHRYDAALAQGVTSPVGGTRRPDAFMAQVFGDTVRLLGAQLAREHLAFDAVSHGSVAFSSAFFLPARQTPAGVETAATAIADLSAGRNVSFSVETPVRYLRPRADEMDDGAFVAAVAERVDCGILLDLHTIWANQRNGRPDARVASRRVGRCRSSYSCTRTASSGSTNYWSLTRQATEPALWGSDEGRRFAPSAEVQCASSPAVQAALRKDCAGLESVRTNQPQSVERDADPVALINAIRHDHPFADLATGRFLVTVGDA